MRHLFLFGLILTPIMMMAQVEEPQFVLAVPDGSGYLSPRADGELIVSKTPRGTFVLRDAVEGAIGTLPKSAQLIRLYWKGGDDLRAMVGREEWRVGSTADGPGLQMRVHRIDARGDKPKLGPTGALQDGSLIALTTTERRRITRGDGGVITLEPASGNGVFEETQYFRLELRDSETAAREWAALVERESKMRGKKKSKKRALSPEEQAEREQQAIAEQRERDAEARRAEAEAEQQRAAQALLLRRQRERQQQIELQRQRDLQAQQEQQQIEYQQQLRAQQEQQRQMELQRQRELQAQQQEQQRQMEYQRQLRVQQEQQRQMELQRQQQALALQQQQAQLDEQRRRNQLLSQPNNAAQSAVAANTSRQPAYQTGDREPPPVSRPAPLRLDVQNRAWFNIRFSVGGGGMSGSILGGQNGRSVELLDRSGAVVVEYQKLSLGWERLGTVPIGALQQAYGVGNNHACLQATGSLANPGLSRCN